MNEKREVILPSDFQERKERSSVIGSAHIWSFCILISDQEESQKSRFRPTKEAVMTVNFSFLGKCEVLLKNGGGTYVDTGEYSIDYGTASREADEFYYPRAQYHGMELILYPCPELDKELSLNGGEYQNER